jgi:valyl-tRNA synthetase
VWSWWREGSVHATSWPSAADYESAEGAADVYRVAGEVLGAIRKAKSDAKQSMRAEVARVVVTDTAERLAALDAARADVCAAGRVATLDPVVGDTFAVEVELAEEPAA